MAMRLLLQNSLPLDKPTSHFRLYDLKSKKLLVLNVIESIGWRKYIFCSAYIVYNCEECY